MSWPWSRRPCRALKRGHVYAVQSEAMPLRSRVPQQVCSTSFWIEYLQFPLLPVLSCSLLLYVALVAVVTCLRERRFSFKRKKRE